MPDFTDGFSADMTEEARKYADGGPAQIRAWLDSYPPGGGKP